MTVKFCDWLEQIGALSDQSKCRVMDVATGKGANICYMKQRFPNCEYVGLDINGNFVEEGNALLIEKGMAGCSLECGDLYDIDPSHVNGFDGIVCHQTLSWLPEYEDALSGMLKLNPEWIALSSLFYDGLVDCKIEVSEYKDTPNMDELKTVSFYNVYSLPRVEKFFSDRGYTIFKSYPFRIDIDLPKPKSKYMQTYTEKLIGGERIQLSGPLLLNWYFICAAK